MKFIFKTQLLESKLLSYNSFKPEGRTQHLAYSRFVRFSSIHSSRVICSVTWNRNTWPISAWKRARNIGSTLSGAILINIGWIWFVTWIPCDVPVHIFLKIHFSFYLKYRLWEWKNCILFIFISTQVLSRESFTHSSNEINVY